ncbi:E3 ubiquitin-protein ligase UBR4-like [Petromyzon marinus]|uniref:E3 ubiquitin-protein ligase UBR4-like n=1 Tax=Petromyzon marinus TaxID=7757 RepID=UPI003F713FB4
MPFTALVTPARRTRAVSREEKAVEALFADGGAGGAGGRERWVESSFEVEGPLYLAVMALHVVPPERWRRHRVTALRRLLVVAHARHVAPGGVARLADKTEKDYSIYKHALLFWGMVELLYAMFKKVPPSTAEGGWSFALAEFVRQGDVALLEASERALRTLQDHLMVAHNFPAFARAAGILEEIENPDTFIQDTLNSLP